MNQKNRLQQEKTPPADVNHYADKYWNDLPEVQAYLCRNATGNDKLWWIPYFKQRYAQTPFRNCLIIACGNGRIERELYDIGIALEFDAFDYSDTYLDEARRQKGSRSINYFKSSFDSLSLDKQYDLVVNVAALHHVDCLDSLLKRIAEAMPPYGMFVNWDYVGPNRNQYTDEHLQLMESVNASLPPKYQTKHPLRHPLQTYIQGDITEAIRSSEIIPTFEEYFEIIERHNLGGGIAYQLLWNNIDEFLQNATEAKVLLQKIIELDETYTRNKEIPSLFAFFLGSPKQKIEELRKSITNFHNGKTADLLEKQSTEDTALHQQREVIMSKMADAPKAKPVSILERFRNVFRQ